MKVFSHYFKKLSPWKIEISTIFCLELALNFIEITVPLLSKVLFDVAYPYHSISLLNILIGLSLVLILIEFFFDLLADYIETFFAQNYILQATQALFNKIQSLKAVDFKSYSTSDLIKLLEEDVAEVVETVYTIPKEVITNILKFTLICYISYQFNPMVTFFFLLSVPVYIFEATFFTKRMVIIEEESIDLENESMDFLYDRLKKQDIIRSYSGEEIESNNYKKKIVRYNRLTVKEKILETVAAFTNSLTLQIWGLVIAWILGAGVINGTLTIGDAIAISLLFGQLALPIEELVGSYSEFKMGMISLKRLNKLEDLYLKNNKLNTNNQSDQAKHSKVKMGEIKFENVSFHYKKQVTAEKDLATNNPTDIIKQCKLTIPAHGVTALVGPSGAGKTTLLNLLQKDLTPTQGLISIDGIDIQNYSIKQIKELIGVVSQNFPLLNGTVLQNIKYGKADATDEEVKAACLSAQCWNFIQDQLEDGMQTIVDDDTLSGGQQQRIALARALLKQPEIYLFDETTSALDPESEYHIMLSISKLAQKRTVIIVAHRLSSIANADNICFLDEGRIIEQGTLSFLLKQKGRFFSFYNKQFSGNADFKNRLNVEYERFLRHGHKFCIGIIAIEPQQINNFSYSEKVEYIEQIENNLIKALRLGDRLMVFEESNFLVLLPDTTQVDATKAFQKLINGKGFTSTIIETTKTKSSEKLLEILLETHHGQE